MNTNKKPPISHSNSSASEGKSREGYKSLISIVEAMSRDLAMRGGGKDLQYMNGLKKKTRNKNKKLKRPTNSVICVPPFPFFLDYNQRGRTRFFFFLKYRPFTDRKWFKKKLLKNMGKNYYAPYLYNFFLRLNSRILLKSVSNLDNSSILNKHNLFFLKLNNIIRTNIHNNMVSTVEYSTLKNMNKLYSMFNFLIFSNSYSPYEPKFSFNTSIKHLLSSFYSLIKDINYNFIENKYLFSTTDHLLKQYSNVPNILESCRRDRKVQYNNSVLTRLKSNLFSTKFFTNNSQKINVSYFYIYTLFYKVFKTEQVISNIFHPLFWRSGKKKNNLVHKSRSFIISDLIRNLSFLPNDNNALFYFNKKENIRSNIFSYMNANEFDKKKTLLYKTNLSNDDIAFVTSIYLSINSKKKLHTDSINRNINFFKSLKIYTTIFNYISTLSFKLGSSKEFIRFLHRTNIASAVKKLDNLSLELRDASIEVKLFKETRNQRIRSYLEKSSLCINVLRDLVILENSTSMGNNLYYLMNTLSILKKYIHYNLLKTKKKKQFLFFKFRKIKRKLKWKKLNSQSIGTNVILSIYGKKRNLKRKLNNKKQKLKVKEIKLKEISALKDRITKFTKKSLSLSKSLHSSFLESVFFNKNYMLNVFRNHLIFNGNKSRATKWLISLFSFIKLTFKVCPITAFRFILFRFYKSSLLIEIKLKRMKKSIGNRRKKILIPKKLSVRKSIFYMVRSFLFEFYKFKKKHLSKMDCLKYASNLNSKDFFLFFLKEYSKYLLNLSNKEWRKTNVFLRNKKVELFSRELKHLNLSSRNKFKQSRLRYNRKSDLYNKFSSYKGHRLIHF